MHENSYGGNDPTKITNEDKYKGSAKGKSNLGKGGRSGHARPLGIPSEGTGTGGISGKGKSRKGHDVTPKHD